MGPMIQFASSARRRDTRSILGIEGWECMAQVLPILPSQLMDIPRTRPVWKWVKESLPRPDPFWLGMDMGSGYG
jgi:hypothetical protein